MPTLPNESFPGPLIRFQMNDNYPAVDLDAEATVDDVIARKLKEDVKVEENEDETTFVSKTNDENEDERKKRSLINFKTIFTRTGIYYMLQERLDA